MSTCSPIRDATAGSGHRRRALLRRRTPIGLLRLGATLVALAGILAFIDSGRLLDRLREVEPFWLLAALAAALPQYLFSALRWRFMTRLFGGDLPVGRAVREYFLAVFLNQTLPGGVPGDAVRTYRDRARAEGLGAAARGVVFERASGQMTLVLVALAGMLLLPGPLRAALPLWAVAMILPGLAAVVALVMLALRRLAARGWSRPRRALAFLRDGRDALFAPRSLLAHTALSLPVVASYLGTFWLAGLSIGVTLDLAVTVAVVPVILLSMVVPLTVAGWGLREGAAAALLAMTAGVEAHQSVAVSVLYGAVMLASSLPGAVVLLRR